MKIVLDREYEVKCTLGTIKDIENSFSKSFYEILADVNKLKLEEQIKLIYVGVKRANPDLLYKDFEMKLEDNMGLSELTEFLEKYLLQLQYPGKTDEEIRQTIEKKLQKAKALKNLTLNK